jgi:CubicO group peptidase (beta-lactamase class C family)
MPDTPSGHIAVEWLRIYNSGDAEAMNLFQLEHSSEALLARADESKRKRMYTSVFEQTGIITPIQLVDDSAERLSLLVRSERGEWLDLEIAFDGGSGKIKGIMFRPSGPPDEELPEGSLTESEAFLNIKEELAEMTSNDEFSGVVLIAKGGDPVFLEAFGCASREHSVLNLADTKFNLGSINKVFTKTAVAMLLSQGKLSLYDTIGEHIEDYPNEEAAEKVTVRHLIEMTSGIGDFFGQRYSGTPKARIRTLEDYLPLFVDKPLEFEPGTDNMYSNGGYVVLGIIIERVSGESYFDFVRKHIFEPAGMEDTDSFEADEIVDNLASGYTRRGPDGAGGEIKSNIYTRPARGSSAGGGYSTVMDLLAFIEAIESNALLPPEYSDWILGGPEPGGRSEGDEGGEPRAIALAGGAPGINSFLEIGLPGGYTVIVMTNLDPPTAMTAGSLVRRRLSRIE